MAQPINDLKMKHTTTLFLLALLALLTPSCGGNKGTQSPQPADTTAVQDTAMRQVITHPDTTFNRDSAFIVVSKQDLTLTIYAPVGGDTLAIEAFPVCMGKNKGDKQSKGDMRTPESPAGQPFTITMIQDASDWVHDFGDGRGSILSYGHWFLRLKTPHSGIATTRTPCLGAPARVAYACSTRTSSPSRSAMPASACPSSSRAKTRAYFPLRKNV